MVGGEIKNVTVTGPVIYANGPAHSHRAVNSGPLVPAIRAMLSAARFRHPRRAACELLNTAHDTDVCEGCAEQPLAGAARCYNVTLVCPILITRRNIWLK